MAFAAMLLSRPIQASQKTLPLTVHFKQRMERASSTSLLYGLGLKLYVNRDRLPAAQEDEFYQADLVGLKAEDRSGKRIGIVAAVQNYGAGDLLEIRLEGKRKTELVPFADAFVLLVDIEAGRVVVALPSGKLETD